MKTVLVAKLDGTWAVKREGTPGSTHPTKAEAIKVARRMIRDAGSGQFVVLSPDGDILQYVTYRLPKVQEPHVKSSRGKAIQRAVGQLALERLATEFHPRRG